MLSESIHDSVGQSQRPEDTTTFRWDSSTGVRAPNLPRWSELTSSSAILPEEGFLRKTRGSAGQESACSSYPTPPTIARVKAEEPSGDGRYSAVACVLAVPLQPGRSYRTENDKGNYAFGYASEEGTFHEETGSPGMKAGSYGVKEADGTQRIVNYIADENGFRASVEVKDQDAPAAAPVDILVAQAHPVAVTTVTKASEPVRIEDRPEGADKAVRKVDDTAVDQSLQSVEQVTEVPEKEPAAPKPVQHVDGVIVQPQMPPLQLEALSPRPQDFPATVFFVPLPQQVAYSRVQSYSVHGYVPVPAVAIPQVSRVPSFQSRVQTGARAQIPQVPPHFLTWQYLGRPAASQQQYPPYQQVQSYMPLVF